MGDGGQERARIVGAGHLTEKEQDNLAATFPIAQGDIPHVGLLHTQVTSASSVDNHDRYAPCATEDLMRTRYHYWALGHIHVRQMVCATSRGYYPGNIQGRNPRETGAKGGHLVTIQDDGTVDVDFRAFAPLQWAELHLNELDEVSTLHDLEQATRGAFEALVEQSSEANDWLLRLRLSGPCPLADEIMQTVQREELEEDLMRMLDVADVEVKSERLSRPIDIASHRGEPHLLGEVLHLIEKARRSTDMLSSIMPEHLAYAPPGEAAQIAYVASLLEGLDGEAALRLLEDR